MPSTTRLSLPLLLVALSLGTGPLVASPGDDQDPLARAFAAHVAGIEKIDVRLRAALTAPERARLGEQRHTALAQARRALLEQVWDDDRTEMWLHQLERLATPLPSAAGGTVTLSGTVTAAATGLPLAGIPVSLQGPSWADLLTDSLGEWSYTGPAGSWKIGVETNPTVWVPRAWPDVSCPGTSLCTLWAEPIEVSSGSTIDDLDFDLVAPGYLTGIVLDASGDPLSDVELSAVPSGEGPPVAAQSGPDGSYSLRVVPGSVRLHAGKGGYRAEVWPDTPCTPICGPGEGAPISVGDGETVTGIDLELLELGSLNVTITRQVDGTPVPMALVTVQRVGGGGAGSGWTNSKGTVDLPSLLDGEYYVSVFFPGLQTVSYPAVPCSNECILWTCDPAGSTPVVVAAKGQTDIEIAMPPLARLTGVVLKEADGLPASGAHVGLRVLAPNECSAGGTSAGPDGTWEIEGHAGTYAAKAGGGLDLLEEIYDGIDCSGPSCNFADADPIVVGVAGVASGIDFTLGEAGSMGGTVVELSSGLAPQHDGSLAVLLVKSDESEAKLASVLSDGTWSRGGLSPGSWYARISWYGLGPTHNYRYMVWPDVQCPFGGSPCPSSLGTVIPLALGEDVTGINFEVERLGRIEGLLSLADPTLPIDPSVDLRFEGPNGWFVDAAVALGQPWAVQRLEPGNYFLRATSPLTTGELWQDLHCPVPPLPCEPTSGTPIAIGTDPDPISTPVALDAAPGIRGFLIEYSTGQPPLVFAASVSVRSVDTGDVQTFWPDETGAYFLPLAPGDWQLWVNGTPDLQSQAWPGVACGGVVADCWMLAQPLTVTAVPAGITADFWLYPLDGLFADGFETGATGRWSHELP